MPRMLSRSSLQQHLLERHMGTELRQAQNKKLTWWQILLIGALLSPGIYMIKVGMDNIVQNAQAEASSRAK